MYVCGWGRDSREREGGHNKANAVKFYQIGSLSEMYIGKSTQFLRLFYKLESISEFLKS